MPFTLVRPPPWIASRGDLHLTKPLCSRCPRCAALLSFRPSSAGCKYPDVDTENSLYAGPRRGPMTVAEEKERFGGEREIITLNSRSCAHRARLAERFVY
jgi:hypothetical protein